MRYCGYCGAELPEYARFCRMCGSYADGEGKNAIDVINPSPWHVPSPDTPVPLLNVSGLLLPQAQDDETVKKPLPAGEAFYLQTWHDLDREHDEYRATGPEMIAPLAAGFGQIPASNVPVVPGTPHIGGVPSIGGTPQLGNMPGAPKSPHLAGHAPAPHEAAHQAPATAPKHTWTWEHHPAPPHHQTPHQQHHPLHHQQHSMPVEHHAPGHKTRWWHRHRRTEHQRRQTHSAHSSHVQHSGIATASKATTGIVAKWAIIVLVAVVVMASGGIIFVLASSPTLSLSGGGTVSAGSILHLHGRGFVPGGSITLTVDNGLPVTLAVVRPVPGSHSDSGAADLAGMWNNEQAQNPTDAIAVGLTGTFDASVVAQASWPAGRNILHAKENTGSRSADVPFILLAQPARLLVNPTALDFGTVPRGSRVAESVLIGNTGGSPLNWTATTNGSSWLALQQSSGTLQPNGAQEALYALVSTGNLQQGVSNTQIVLHSNGGSAQIAVHIQVGPSVKTRQAKLNVNPATLDFGQLSPGQQVSDTLSIGNKGTLALQWQGSISGAGWLSLSLSNGSVQPGGIPQLVQVTVDTRQNSLQTGSNTASIVIQSNGGNVTIPVTLTLLSGSTPTPTPSPSPSPSPRPSPSPTPIQRTITSQQTQSQTVNATGQGTIPGTQASGTVCIDNFDTTAPLMLAAGSTYSNTYPGSPSFHMVLDATESLPPAPSSSTWSQACGPAHVLEVGTVGNNIFNNNQFGTLTYSVFTNSALKFTNGTDPQTYTVVQQSDIDAAANSLEASTRQSAVADLTSQLHPNEHLVGNPQCTYNVTSDHAAGDRATAVTVTVQAMCTAIAST
jgi:hypothetical protein